MPQPTALDDVGVVYTNVLLDSPGTLGLASARVVGRCGESFPGLLDRWGVWLATNASNVRDVSTHWGSVDAGDLMLATCHDTKYLVSSSSLDLWNNPTGLRIAVEAARATGCVVEFLNPDTRVHSTAGFSSKQPSNATRPIVRCLHPILCDLGC